MNNNKHTELANHAWSVADLLRGDYKQSDYGKVILPFTVLRRLECVLEPTRDKVIARAASLADQNVDLDRFLPAQSGHRFYNTSKYRLKTIAGDSSQAGKHLLAYIGAFSKNAQEVLEKYDFPQQIKKLDDADLLYQVIGRFADLDLRPVERDDDGNVVLDDNGQPVVVVDNHQMGYIFERLIRQFAELSNETAGEHFTPREVIELMVNLLVAPDDDTLNMPGVVRTVLDPACGTGGMLTAMEEHIRKLNPLATVEVFGQELNPESWAICRSDLMIKGQDPDHIKFGNSFSNDGYDRDQPQHTFDYLLANPPFGVEWKKVKDDIEDEYKNQGISGRFGAGLPRINDGSLLFLQHMISKMKPVDARGVGGSRIAIVFNGSPLFTGAAESGESKIRQWILENDWLEAIVALPDQLFYNTGISTYFWIVTNRKAKGHKGKVVLLDARDYFAKMRKSLGDKRKYVTPDQIDEISRLYAEALNVSQKADHPLRDKVRVFANEDFGYHRITVERPLKLRFEITDETLVLAELSKILSKHIDIDRFIRAIEPLIGRSWKTKSDAFENVRIAIRAAGMVWPAKEAFRSGLRDVIGVRDPDGEVQMKKGEIEPDPDLRDYENLPFDVDIEVHARREIFPHVPDAWIDHSKTKIGYEIPFTRHFHSYRSPRQVAEINSELKNLESQIQKLLGEVTE